MHWLLQYAMWPSGLSPDLDTILPDYFGGRFTFYMRVNRTARYSFVFNSIDDVARLYVVGARLHPLRPWEMLKGKSVCAAPNHTLPQAARLMARLVATRRLTTSCSAHAPRSIAPFHFPPPPQDDVYIGYHGEQPLRVNLTAGRPYKFEVMYYENLGGTSISMVWDAGDGGVSKDWGTGAGHWGGAIGPAGMVGGAWQADVPYAGLLLGAIAGAYLECPAVK